MFSRLRQKALRAALGTHCAAAALRWISGRHASSLKTVRKRPPVTSNAILCLVPVKDEALRLKDFLRHHRMLGVDRFIFIDNGSTDGTLEMLEQEADVDLYATDMDYPTSRYGATWITGLAHQYGTDRWILYVDADEHLVYDGIEDHGLHALTQALDRMGRRSLPAMMLDMYGSGPISETALGDGQSLVEAAPYFDGTGYGWNEPPPDRWNIERHYKYSGGPRQRLFKKGSRQFQSELAKTPLVKWDRWTAQYFSHAVYPMPLNFGEPRGCLLHFKYLSDFGGRTEAAVQSGQFYAGSIEAKSYKEGLQQNPDLAFRYEGSVQYQSSQTLKDLGLVSPIDWSGDT